MKKIITTVFLAAGPMFAFAQTNAFSLANLFSSLLKAIIPILFMIALVYFFWGVIRYVISKDADDVEKMKSVIVRGVIGLFVMTSIWGLVAFINRSVGIPQDGRGDTVIDTKIPSALPPGF